ncbi:MAG: endopeptidase La [Patescibacteria group bacterium]|jgi:ATP-dependent Lon protease
MGLLDKPNKPGSTRNVTNPETMTIPMVPLRDVVIFPHLEIVLSFGRPQSVKAVEKAFNSNKLIFFVAQKNPAVNAPGEDDLYTVGTICQIERLLKSGEEINALVRGVRRAKILNANLESDYYESIVKPVEEVDGKSDESKALVKVINNNLKKAVNLGKPVDFLVFMKLMSGVTDGELADQVASILDISTIEKQKLLETPNVLKRLKKISDLINKELKILEIEQSIASKTQKKFDKSMREAVLRERMKTIQKELGEAATEESADPEISEFQKKIKTASMPIEVKQKIEKEINRLSKMHSYNPEAGYIRTYLEVVTDLPWGKTSETSLSSKRAEKVLNQDHYGLEEVKERILEYLSVMSLKRKQQDILPKEAKATKSTTILCFVGPPGVGKTSLGKSIARSLGRKFIKVSIGGIRDEAEIRGHRRTYVGAMPGRIVQGIKDAGTMDPVFMLDEIDKIGSDFRGDPSSALLEALDPEQNFAFSDHYLEVPFDLSKVLFITTANVLDTIPPALRDRLEIIRFSGYTDDEKYHIAKNYLIKKTMYGSGLLEKQITVTPTAIKKIIHGYTKEAGVRGLERELNKIMRKVAKKITAGEISKAVISGKNLHDYLGPQRFTKTLAESKDEVGLSTGLAWTQVGGDILFIEVGVMPGKGRLTITGQLGDVMKESCRAALTYLRGRWKELGLPEDVGGKYDFHIHVPEGAVPKDGPSAGVAIVTALYSAMSKRKVRKDIGMTGEITLRGRVLEIGGLKEKLIAAHRSGLKTVIIPKSNEKDLEEVPEKVKKALNIRFSRRIEDVLNVAVVH